MSVYQPMSGLNRPVAINTDYANFTGVALTLLCLPGPLVEPDQAEDQCRKLSQLFENQGARVETRTSPGRVEDPDGDVEAAEPTAEETAPALALTIELSARLIHREVTNFLWWAITTDYTFAQDIVIRDSSGFLLLKDTLTGRFVRRLGFSRGAGPDFSRDYYNQLSQLTLNARMRRQVLGEAQLNAAAK